MPQRNSRDLPDSSPSVDEFWNGDWLRWLGVISSLWDVFSMLAAFVVGIIILAQLSRTPPRDGQSSTELLTVVASALVATAILVLLAFMLVYFWITKAEPGRIRKSISQLKRPLSARALRALLVGEPLSLATLNTRLAEDKEAGRAKAENWDDCNELFKAGLAKLQDDKMQLTGRVRRHKELTWRIIEPEISAAASPSEGTGRFFQPDREK